MTGVDLNGLALAAALGEPLAASELARSRRGASAAPSTRFLVAPPGMLESVEVPQGLSGVVATRLYREPGHVFGPLRRAADRAGAVLAAGATPRGGGCAGRGCGGAHTLRDGRCRKRSSSHLAWPSSPRLPPTTRGGGGVLLRNRSFRLVGTLVVTALAALYIVAKIDIGKTRRTSSATPSLAWLALSALLTRRSPCRRRRGAGSCCSACAAWSSRSRG